MPFSRIPLFEGTEREHISGYFLKAELLENLVQGNGDQHLSSIKRDITVVHESFPISELFNQILKNREHIALVVDEYGGMAGIVTMEDVMETLLGLEITDESDSTVDMQALARKNWELRARRIGLIKDAPLVADKD
ncbi:MAG: CBS domain-containing protein [Thermoanaerobaculales bacterium]|nr:CBS domain-containing protein [Thermoanaerobaculales bacterium]